MAETIDGKADADGKRRKVCDKGRKMKVTHEITPGHRPRGRDDLAGRLREGQFWGARAGELCAGRVEFQQ